METLERQEADSGLKAIVVEASRALAHLDAGRLEELSVSCQALNRAMPTLSRGRQLEFACQINGASRELVTLAQILEATRVNVRVIRQLREIRLGRRAYGEEQGRGWMESGSAHGDN